VTFAAPGKRYLFFTNECVGLGHLRRALTLAGAVVDRDHDASALVVTGSAVASSYRLPPRVDTLKLPLLDRDEEGVHRAGQLGVSSADAHELRARLALAAAESFEPTVAVVEKTPLGLRNELVPALRVLRERGTRIVLGLRDIEDAPDQVRRRWLAGRAREAVEGYYDAVLVYGPAGGADAIACLGWDATLSIPVHRVGYVGVPVPAAPAADEPYVLATAGGGVDGELLLTSFVEAVRLRPLGVRSLVVTGPLMPARAVARLRRLAAGADVQVVEFRTDMEAVVAGAQAVVAMAGYNTVSELLRTRRPALLVPRVRPSCEQLVRASMLATAGAARMLHPDELSPERLRLELDALLSGPPPRHHALLDGTERATELLLDLAAGAERELPVAAECR
jgi:predicted glycosyltransferase